MTISIDESIVLSHSNIVLSKYFAVITSSHEWTENKIKELSTFFQAFPKFVIVVHSEDDQNYSKISNVQYPILHLTHNKVREKH